MIAAESMHPWYKHDPSSSVATARWLLAFSFMHPCSTGGQLPSLCVASALYSAKRLSVHPP